MTGADFPGELQTLAVEQDEGVLVVTLDRPEALNALDTVLMAELKGLWAALPGGVRCIVLPGAGKGFGAGADMSLLESDRGDAAETVAEELAFLPGDRVEVPV